MRFNIGRFERAAIGIEFDLKAKTIKQCRRASPPGMG
jgi:hypothetical protein